MNKKLIPVMVMGIIIFTMCGTTNTPVDILAEPVPPDAVLRTTPFSRGVNFSGWFESSKAEGIPFTRYTEQDFADVKSLGADVIRLPVRLHDMAGLPPQYTLDPLFIKFLDLAVDWAEKYELYLIIDNHSFDPAADTSTDIDQVLLPVWAQIAERYKDRSDYIIYEILNEPHGISDKRWGEIQGMAIETIRAIDQRHAIMVGGADWNSQGSLSALPKYTDPNLIYTFHFYDPFLFTHQGATWAGSLIDLLEGVPFPMDSKRMPKLPRKLWGTWLANSLRNDYPKDASPQKLRSALDKAVVFSRERDVPIFCGEFGVYIIHSPPEDRIRWYEFITDALEKRNISRTSWDYYGGFGIFNTGNGGDFNADLNVGVVRAMGFTPPPQQPRQTGPLMAGFTLYDDYAGRDFNLYYWGESDYSMYDTSAAEGEYAIRWGNANQYDAFYFGFLRNGDLSYLVEAGYVIEFKARTERPVRFDVRFLNPDRAPVIPWRMRYTIDEQVLPPDGNWHTIRIPLREMQEHGAWVSSTQAWINPHGEFSWEKVDLLQFSAEHEALTNRVIWFDSIRVVEP